MDINFVEDWHLLRIITIAALVILFALWYLVVAGGTSLLRKHRAARKADGGARAEPSSRSTPRAWEPLPRDHAGKRAA